MSKQNLIAIIVILLCNTIAGQTIFDKLNATDWEGTGTLMNTPTTYTMCWKWTLDKTFSKLVFQHKRMDKNEKEIVFKANAYYKIIKDAKIEGTWFDSRGVTLPLTGTFSENELIIIWGSPETEQGKTIYTLQPNKKISVTDYILNKGDYLKFSEALYQKIKPDN